jgi:hypothetical protein
MTATEEIIVPANRRGTKAIPRTIGRMGRKIALPGIRKLGVMNRVSEAAMIPQENSMIKSITRMSAVEITLAGIRDAVWIVGRIGNVRENMLLLH